MVLNKAFSVVFLLGLFLVSTRIPCFAADAITLRVALYPYVPDRYAVFTLLAREFQRRNEGVTVDLAEVDPNKDYYDDGLLTLDADVYEIDSILLSDMIRANKIAPLNVSLNDFAKESIDAVTRDNVVYAVPHWLCGNFLFYRKGDVGIRDAVTWSDLIRTLRAQKRSLMIDLFGRLTLGEWYITMLVDRIGVAEAQSAVLANSTPDATVVSDLRSLFTACAKGHCRSRDLHDRTGYYARAFIRGEAAAYVGYSETMYYALQEAINNCRSGSKKCLPTDSIVVRRLPRLKVGSTAEGIGWVDGLAISSSLSDAKKAIALKFIEFVTSPDAYKLVLEPQWMEAPRYLLPARLGLQILNAPLYPNLIAAHEGRKTGNAPGLSAHLRALATKLNCQLPIEADDKKTQDSCKKVQ